jgi:hypothetical protein
VKSRKIKSNQVYYRTSINDSAQFGIVWHPWQITWWNNNTHIHNLRQYTILYTQFLSIICGRPTSAKCICNAVNTNVPMVGAISSSPAKSSHLLTFGEPLVKSSGFPCVHILEIWLVANRIFRLISGHESMKTITSSFVFCKERQSQVNITTSTRPWRHVCTSRTTVLKCGWHVDTLLQLQWPRECSPMRVWSPWRACTYGFTLISTGAAFCTVVIIPFRCLGCTCSC